MGLKNQIYRMKFVLQMPFDELRKILRPNVSKQILKEFIENYIVRNVCTNEEIIQRNIVEETIDSKGQKLSYKQNEAILIFNRKAETISTAIVEQGGMAEDLAEEACKLFELYKTCHNGQAISNVFY